MISNEHISDCSSIKNKGFLILDEIFKNNGWHLLKNENDWIIYTKTGDETNYFEIKILKDKIHVSVPITNSIYQYNAIFKNYFEASEFIEQKFFQHINKTK
jgi:hypothetical protein